MTNRSSLSPAGQSRAAPPGAPHRSPDPAVYGFTPTQECRKRRELGISPRIAGLLCSGIFRQAPTIC